MNVWNGLSHAISVVFPRRCAACAHPVAPTETVFCAACSCGLIQPETCCLRCGVPITVHTHPNGTLCGRCLRQRSAIIHRSWWAFEYGGAIQEALKRLKYNGDWTLGPRLGALWQPPPVWGTDTPSWDMVCAVPLYWRRRIQRGFNQSTLMARVIATRLHVPLVTNVLNRSRGAAAQVRLRAQERAINVRNAFWISNPEKIQGKRVLLIDDVVTTGATVRACAKVLRRKKAKSVCVWSLTRRL